MFWKKLCCGWLLAFLLPTLDGQTYQGAIRGIVRDSTGAAVAGARITLTDQATNVPRSTNTNTEGEYVFNAVDPALYSVAAESANFKKFVRRDVQVTTQASVTTDIELELGTISQSVEVTEEIPVVEGSNASNGQGIDSQKMTDLP